MFFLNKILQLNNQGTYILAKQIKKKDRQKYLLMSSDQRLSEEDRNQLLKKERYFKCHKFKHLMTDCTAKKQNVSNVAEKNNTESVSTRKKTSKRYRSSAINDKSEN